MPVLAKLFKYMVVTCFLSVTSVFVSSIAIDLVCRFLSVVVPTVTIFIISGCVGATVAVLTSCFLAWLFHLQDSDFIGALVPLQNFQRQIKSLDLKIPEGDRSLDTLKSFRGEVEASVQALDRLANLTGAINQQFGTLSAQEVEALRMVISDQLKGCALEFTNKGFTVIWNSLPYHQYFDKMDDEDKVAYFNAIHTGNWQPLRRRSKDKWKTAK